MDDPRINIPDFLDALCRFIVTAAAAPRTLDQIGPIAGTTLVYAPPVPETTPPTKRHLFRNQASESDALDPYTVLRVYPGPAQTYASHVPRINVQVQTTGTNDDAAMQQANVVFAALQDRDYRPLRMTQIAGGFLENAGRAFNSAPQYTIISVKPLQTPGVIGRDVARGRAIVSWNMEIAVEAEYVYVA